MKYSEITLTRTTVKTGHRKLSARDIFANDIEAKTKMTLVELNQSWNELKKIYQKMGYTKDDVLIEGSESGLPSLVVYTKKKLRLTPLIKVSVRGGKIIMRVVGKKKADEEVVRERSQYQKLQNTLKTNPVDSARLWNQIKKETRSMGFDERTILVEEDLRGGLMVYTKRPHGLKKILTLKVKE